MPWPPDPYSIIYLGNYTSSGRYCWDAHWHDIALDRLASLVGDELAQATFHPTSVEGEAQLHHLNGWTILAFANYTDDSSSDSNCIFFLRDAQDFRRSMDLISIVFPHVLRRLNFTIRETSHPRPPSSAATEPTLF